MVESVSFEKSISHIFEQEYDDKIAEKALNAYKIYLEEYQTELENGFDFKVIETDICGKDDDPTKSNLYSTFLKALQTNDLFQTEQDKNKLYSILLSIVNGILISYNQPWNVQNRGVKPKKKNSAKGSYSLQQINLADDNSDNQQINTDKDDEKYHDKQEPNIIKKSQNDDDIDQNGDGDDNYDDAEDPNDCLSDLE